MLAEAVGWWAARMTELVPEQLTRRDVAGGDAVIIAAEAGAGAAASILLRRNGRETPLGAAPSEGRALRASLNGRAKTLPVLVRPPPGVLLEKQVVLPIAAERDLMRVIGYDIDRLTPFGVEDVFWTAVVERRDPPRGRLHVRLSLVPKAAVLSLLAALDQADIPATALEAPGLSRLIPLRHDAEQAGWQLRTTRHLAITCAVLAAIAIALPFLLQSLALDALERRNRRPAAGGRPGTGSPAAYRRRNRRPRRDRR